MFARCYVCYVFSNFNIFSWRFWFLERFTSTVLESFIITFLQIETTFHSFVYNNGISNKYFLFLWKQSFVIFNLVIPLHKRLSHYCCSLCMSSAMNQSFLFSVISCSTSFFKHLSLLLSLYMLQAFFVLSLEFQSLSEAKI